MLERAIFEVLPLLVFALQRDPALSARWQSQYGARPSADMVLIKGGEFTPAFPANEEEREVWVPAFWLDRDPVTNGDFLRFVRSKPEYRRDRITRLLAEPGYLQHWHASQLIGESTNFRAPVVNVSWFAAKAFCEWRGARLPSEVEWELAAAASVTERDARASDAWRSAVLEWYSHPTLAVLPEVGQSRANYWGVRDLHGLVWEWVFDFNSALVSSDSRGTADDRQSFCGAAGIQSGNKLDYASFMRRAFQSSLEASYVTGNLGFRCAKDAAGPAS